MAEKHTQKRSSKRVPKAQHKKLPRLPDNAKIIKRPLLRPAIPSPYSGAQNQKIIYVSAKTPFLSAVKRVEKLLRLADKRLVQSATTLAKEGKGKGKGYGKRRRGSDEDEIAEIAQTIEGLKKTRRMDGKGGESVGGSGEEVVVRGTGKAIQRVLELGLWFQQREEYAVRLGTGSVGAVDDIEVDEMEDAGTTVQGAVGEGRQAGKDTEPGANSEQAGEQMDVDSPETSRPSTSGIDGQTDKAAYTTERLPPDQEVEIPETRIRYTSSLEVYVSLR